MRKKFLLLFLIPFAIYFGSCEPKVDCDYAYTITPGNLDFGSSQTSLDVKFENQGSCPFKCTIDQTSIPSWLSISRTDFDVAANEFIAVTFTVNRTSLDVGTTEKYIKVNISDIGDQQILVKLSKVVNTEPTASFTVSSTEGGYVNQNFNVDASGSIDDIDGAGALQVRWQWEAGGEYTAWSFAKTSSHAYGTSGSKTITLEVKDTQGAVGYISQNVNVLAPTKPTVSTLQPNNISHNSAYFTGKITELGNGATEVTQHGHCWSTSSTFSIDNCTGKTLLGSTNVEGLEFQSHLTDLIADKTYYVMAYATNVAGTEYGGITTFTTTIPEPPLNITTYQPSAYSQATADVSGMINSFPVGVNTATAHGFCWSKQQNPTTLDLKRDLGSTSTAGILFFHKIENLEPNTLYYVRAFMTTSAGTQYGNQIFFTTKSNK